jgi:hypothetical protein
MTALKKQKSCKDLVTGKWKKRQQDLTNPEFEGLSFDYVEPHTFTDQAEGYWRWQFSWGGPSDELRAYVNRDDSIHRLEYWYLDWFDGAKVNVAAEHAAWSKMQEMITITAPETLATIHMYDDLARPA